MPSEDRTFSDEDLIRIFQRHLTAPERVAVMNFFRELLDISPPDGDNGLPDNLSEFGELIIELFLEAASRIHPTLVPILSFVGTIINTIDLGGVVEEALGTGGETEA